jgi:hypothetical protein
MPFGKDENRNNWYSFNYGSVHFIIISLEHNFLKNSSQYNRLKYDLTNVNRKLTPWIIISGHRPIYVSANYTEDNLFAEGIQRELDSLFYEYKVDVYLSGHYHSYERTCKLFNYQCVDDGVVHILSGAPAYLDEEPWLEPKPSWSIIRFQKLGYSKFFVNGDILNGVFVNSKTGEIEDKFEILKK